MLISGSSLMIEPYDPSLVFFWADLASSRSYENIGLSTQVRLPVHEHSPQAFRCMSTRPKLQPWHVISTSSTLTDIWRFPICRLQISFVYFYVPPWLAFSMQYLKHAAQWGPVKILVYTWFKCDEHLQGEHVSSQQFIQEPVCETVEYHTSAKPTC